MDCTPPAWYYNLHKLRTHAGQAANPHRHTAISSISTSGHAWHHGQGYDLYDLVTHPGMRGDSASHGIRSDDSCFNSIN